MQFWAHWSWTTNHFFFFLLAENFRPTPDLKKKQALKDESRGSPRLLDLSRATAGSALSHSHFKGPGPAQGRCPGEGFAQELRPIQRGISLLLPLPRVVWCRPARAKPMTSALAGHTALPISNYKLFLEGETHFNPKASPTEDTAGNRERAWALFLTWKRRWVAATEKYSPEED